MPLLNRIDLAIGLNDRVRIHTLMAIVRWAPQAQFHAGFQISPKNPPEFAYIRATQGHKYTLLRQECFSVTRLSATFLCAPILALWHGTHRDNARSIM